VIWFTRCPNKQHDLGRDLGVWNVCRRGRREVKERSLINRFYLLPKKAW